MASPSLFTGERAVMAVFVARIISLAPYSILYEAISLFILSILAISVEIFADNHSSTRLSRPFKTRPGASSGIFLGAVTLPGLMVSKLIQMSRALSFGEVRLEELEYLQILFWVTSTICFSVLVFLVLVPFREQCLSHYIKSSWIISCICLYIGVCCFYCYLTSHPGWYAAFIPLWLSFHGLAAVFLIVHILNTFPACASIGEALLVTSGLVAYVGDMFVYTASKTHKYLPLSNTVVIHYISRSETSTIIQGITIGLLLLPMFFKSIIQVFEHFAFWPYTGGTTDNGIRRSFLFYVLLAIIMAVVVPSWMQVVQNFHMHPFLWVFDFVFSEPLKSISLCIYWLILIYASVVRFYNISKHSRIERILLRKYYHLLAVMMFIPALIFQPKFLDLAFGVALAIFLVLEIIRIWRVWPLGQLVHQFMNAFTDHRDSELLIVSHFSLLLGCALPIWLSSGFNDRPLAPFAGILSLGIGDTMASLVGHKYGVLRWTKTGKKTIEGTAAGITSVLAACSVLLPLLATTGYLLTKNLFSLLLAVTLSGLLEAYTAQLDNAFIPLMFYSLLCL
ncbi:unnamed protein product [Cuscuta campestris]|uniref:dolichol kinase n=1 Tax=Cuscuta campestris TaxID=132261 RepID=A0A484N6Q5_9ASTE|nr:unnamed protein product [Cuscuta campestris]